MNQSYYRIVDEDVSEIAKSDLPWESLKNKTVLITGANGYLASYMVFTLLKRNDLFGDNIHVVALCRNAEKAKDRFAPMLERSDIEFLIQDVCVPIRYEKRVDVVIHAAGDSTPPVTQSFPVETIRTHIEGTYNLLERAVRDKSIFIYLSSSYVYGDCEQECIDEESSGLIKIGDIRYIYNEAKRAGELLCAAFASEYNVSYKVARLSVVYGPATQLNRGSAMADFLRSAYYGKPIVITGNAEARRSFCYIADAVGGVFTILLKGKNQDRYNISSENNDLSIKELAELFCEVFFCRNLKIKIEGKDTEKQRGSKKILLDCTKLKKMGWKEHWSIRDGIIRDFMCLDDLGALKQ